MTLAASINQSRQLPLATAYTRTFFMGVTGLTLTLTISKAGAAFAAIVGSVSELTLGWYAIALDAADTDTQGDLAYHATDGGTNIENWSDQVAGYVTLSPGVVHQGIQLILAGAQSDPTLWVTNTLGDATNSTSTGGNGRGIAFHGAGAGAGLYAHGGDSSDGSGMECFGGGQYGYGARFNGTSDGHGSGGEAFRMVSAGAQGLVIEGAATGIYILAGTGPGIDISTPGGGVPINALVPTTGNTTNSIMDCLNAARADGFGKWVKSGTTFTLYAADGTTVVRTFTLDSATAPTSRT